MNLGIVGTSVFSARGAFVRFATLLNSQKTRRRVGADGGQSTYINQPVSQLRRRRGVPGTPLFAHLRQAAAGDPVLAEPIELPARAGVY